jgi:ACT domain-containing protein
MPKFINGPTNYAHLKGMINGVEKNVYLFMDTHYELDEQTKCESFDSIDISHYLYRKIKDTINPLDFFMDKHYDLNEQTKCESFDSIDISHYLYRKIKDTINRYIKLDIS